MLIYTCYSDTLASGRLGDTVTESLQVSKCLKQLLSWKLAREKSLTKLIQLAYIKKVHTLNH